MFPSTAVRILLKSCAIAAGEHPERFYLLHFLELRLDALLFGISLKTNTTPIMEPSRSLIGAPLSAISRSVPSRAISAVWFASPTIPPDSSTFSTGFSQGSLVISLMMMKILLKRFPVGLLLCSSR